MKVITLTVLRYNIVTDIDDCSMDPCQNGGTCIVSLQFSLLGLAFCITTMTSSLV